MMKVHLLHKKRIQSSPRPFLSLRWFLLLLVLGGSLGLHCPEAFGATVIRRALLVHHERGWPGEKKLKYTQRDVNALASVLNHKGNFHIKILTNPTPSVLRRQLKRTHKQLRSDKRRGLQTHFLFYYSGHADRKFLHLGPQSKALSKRYHLKTLAHSLRKLPTSIKIVILDTCYAGALIEMMGGSTKGRRPQRARYFPIEQGSQKVTAVLASSVSQALEIKRLHKGGLVEKSIFTHYLVKALKGKADKDGDGNVSITEAFAYTRTKTIQAAKGLQDPTRYLEIKGHNAYPLTAFYNTRIIFPVQRGDIFILSGLKHGVLMRFQAQGAGKREVSVLSGRYRVFVRTRAETCYQSTFTFRANRRAFKFQRRQLKKSTCPTLAFWQQKGPKRLRFRQEQMSPEDESDSWLQERHLSLFFSGGILAQTVIPPYLGGTAEFGSLLPYGAWRLMLTFQMGSREDFRSYYPEVSASWGWELTRPVLSLYIGPMFGVGGLIVHNTITSNLSLGVNLRYGLLAQLLFKLHPSVSIGLGVFAGASSSQRRSEGGIAWATAFSARGALGIRFHL